MRISDLIQELEETMEIYGDLPIVIRDTSGIDEYFAEIYDAQVISRLYDRYLELKR